MQTNGYSCQAGKPGRYIRPSAYTHRPTITLAKPFPEQGRNLENLFSNSRQNFDITSYFNSSKTLLAELFKQSHKTLLPSISL